ncbi:hypothetical protein QU795_24565, partial [Escherichia coli]|nr:hypothetical protein [Escherichia coli]
KRVFLVILFTSFSGSLVSRIPGAVQNASFPLVSRKSSLLYRVRVRKHRFATTTRHTGTAQPPQSPRLSPDGHIPDYFLRFSPVVMPVKVVRCFHHQRRLRLTTSGGTFS